ncbi:MAG: hypothetical protein AAFU69_00175, partial [Pseudomonadota bacterium]
QSLHRCILISFTFILNACVSAIPIARDADMLFSGAVGGHLFPPQHYATEADWLRDNVVIKRVPGHEVGPTCALYGNPFDMFVAECVKAFEDGSVLVILPTCPDFAPMYCDLAEQHAWGHVYQAKMGREMTHDGWGRFQRPPEPQILLP